VSPEADQQTGAAAAPASRRMTRALGRTRAAVRIMPRAAWTCAVIASLNAACWSLITPPFQVPDEPSHFAYVQQLAETGTLPTSASSEFSGEELVALRNLQLEQVRSHPEAHPVSTGAAQRRLTEVLDLSLRRSGPGGAGVAASQPPLYYALLTIPYALGSGGNLLVRLELMRLLSALMAGATALFVYLFAREALPRVPWAWTVGGLAVALTPLLGLMSGAVNPDAMLFAVSAATFYLLARGFRRGLTSPLAVAIGVAIALGLLTKLNFIGLLPGIVVAIVLLARRAARSAGLAGYRSAAYALAIPGGLACLYIVINLFSNHAGLGQVSAGLNLTGRGSALSEISYLWQFYLPRLPGMTSYFPGISTTLQIWLERSTGLYGWLDTQFPPWVDTVALLAVGLLTVLGVRELVAVRGTLHRRAGEMAAYALMCGGLLILIGGDQYGQYVLGMHETYAQPRYLLPLLPLFAAGLALSARGAGRRWGPAAGALIVVLFLAHDLFSQLQVISRFYG
jgi:4-amino-4-deoxy-L-arabinose transferase-like glycosyltransferase